MPLTLESRRVGDIAIVKCSGRIVEGAESSALQRCLNDLLPFGANILLNLSGVDFVDSSGLGLLVRFLTRAQTARGNLKLCGANSQMSEVLKITKLNTLLTVYATEDEAVADFYRRAQASGGGAPDVVDILCVERSADVLAYVRELLRRPGYGVLSVTNLADAVTLLRATKPKMIVISGELHTLRGTTAAEYFNELAGALPVVELPAGFSSDDPGQAGQQLLDRVHAVLGGSASAAG